MKSYIVKFSCNILILFSSGLISQTIIPAGNVSGTWAKVNSPYHIEGEITIPNDSALIIDPGVIVEFQGYYKFNVHGKILAIGELADTITFTINDTTGFSNFEIPDGGWHGLRFQNELSTDTSILTFCRFEFGKAIYEGKDGDDCGGAIYASDYAVLHISNCLIINNWSEHGGGGMYDTSTEVVIVCSSFVNNMTDTYGGGLFTGESLIVSCKFEYNFASQHGGGINWDGFSPVLINNIISYNSSGYCGGGIACIDDFGAKLINNTICHNNTIFYGGGIDINSVYGPFEIINTILYGNIAEDGNQVYGAGGEDLIAFQYCNIEGGIEGFGGLPFQGVYIGNIDSDPLFNVSGEHPYSLSSFSPCLDTGIFDTTGLNLPIFDIAGNPRMYNNRIDIGAYEYGIYPPCFTSEPLLSAAVNEEYNYQITAKDLTGNPIIFDYNVLPGWLTLNSSDTNFAQLYGIPQIENIGENPVEITVSNSLFETTQSYFITVQEVGIEEENNETFTVSPNPAQSTFYLITHKNKILPYKVELLTCTGKRLKSYKINEKEFIIDVGDIPKGIYFIRIMGKKKIEIKKLILY